MSENPLVIYHGGCWDGFCAAWVLRKVFGEAEFVPAQYGQEPPNCTGRRVFIVDFSYKRPVMRSILSQAKAVVVLDHHKTAEAELAGLVDEFIQRPDLIHNPDGSELPFVHFDMNKSGGRLTWEWLQQSGHGDFKHTPTPWLVDYTEDRDLWRWKLDWSREINAFIRSWPLDFAKWNEFNLIGPGCGKWDTWIDAGSAILRREKQIVDDHVKNAVETEMDGHKILAVNATVLFSEIAGELAKDRPFGAAYFIRSDGKRVWSLRSRDGGVDVSEIAKAHGGGGHRNAAGFEEGVIQ